MILQKIFFLIILIILIIYIFIYPKYQIDYSLNNNLLLVDDFANNKLQFNIIKNPSKKIIKYQTFYDISIYPELSKINYQIIKKELINYINSFNNNWTEWVEYELWKNKNNSSWKIIPLMAFGKWSQTNIKLFPETIKQLKNINNLVSAGFSKLGPETTLNLHKGWGDLSNNVLRCHLGLIVPKSKCKVFVIGSSNDFMYQKKGKWIIFDDSLYHSASNEDLIKDRIILLLDIKRPSSIAKGISDVKNSPELNNFIDKFNSDI